MPPIVELRNVSVTYSNGVLALSDLDLTIEQGEFAFLVGATGHGKSTVLKLLYCDEYATKGQVIVSAWDVAKLSPGRVARLRRRLGVVFQDFRLLPRTAWENVAFSLHATGHPYRDVLRRVPEALAEVGLLDKADDYPSQLSAGEQQSLAIARVLAIKPALILADEPTGNLDPDSSAHIMTLLSKANGEGATVLVATHDPAIVNAKQSRVIAMRHGQIFRDTAEGSYPDDLERD
ncbi:MAG TPA: ATP-binding cassette domain-containing protein [Armatimonadota bacterium]|nr:ATP-binding cassette domain-containing protein [Armatimonadota bacterium]